MSENPDQLFADDENTEIKLSRIIAKYPAKSFGYIKLDSETQTLKENWLSLPLPKVEKILLNIIFTLGVDAPEGLVTGKDIIQEIDNKKIKVGKSGQTIYRYLSGLSKKGVFRVRNFTPMPFLKTTIKLLEFNQFAIAHKALLEFEEKEKARKKFNKSAGAIGNRPLEDAAKKAGSVYDVKVENHREIPAVTDSLLMGVLDRCVRSSVKHNVADNILVSNISFKGGGVQVITSAKTSDSIMIQDDAPVFRAYLSIVCDKIDYALKCKKPLKNNFIISLVDIARVMQFERPSATPNVYKIWKSLYRCADTTFEFEIDDESSAFVKHFGFDSSDTANAITSAMRASEEQIEIDAIAKLKRTRYRYLSKIEEWELRNDRSESLGIRNFEGETFHTWFVTSLDDYTWERLINQNEVRAIFRAHPTILKNRSGMIHSIYSYFRAVLAPTKPGQKDRPLNIYLNELARRIFPAMPYADFKAKFIREYTETVNAENSKENDENRISWDEITEAKTFKFYGYFITIYEAEVHDRRFDPLKIKVIRDKTDFMIGDEAYSAIYRDWPAATESTKERLKERLSESSKDESTEQVLNPLKKETADDSNSREGETFEGSFTSEPG